jgi:hypothetical protein
MRNNRTDRPGQDWLDIVTQPTLEGFASAFTEGVTLVTSVASASLVGPIALRHFFEATRGMYDTIAFAHEMSVGSRTCLEWSGKFQGRDVAGVTVLRRDALGRIESIQLLHSPYEQVIAFSAELARRLDGQISPSPFHDH